MAIEPRDTQDAIRTTRRYTQYAIRKTHDELIMQNKPNFLNAQMNINFCLTKHYEQKPSLRQSENKPKTNPIQTQSNPLSKRTKYP